MGGLKLWWYIARAGGLVSWALLAGSVLWGLALSTRVFRSRPRPAWMLGLHRWLGGSAVVFTGIHLAGLVGDTFIHFGPAELFVPLASRWHPVAVAWGVVALYLLLAIEISSLGMRRLSNKAWRRIHRLSFGLYALGTIHALAAGTDVRGGAVRWAAIAITTTVVFLWLLRVLGARPSRRAARPQPGVPAALRSQA